MTASALSVVIRVRDEARALERLLALLARQSQPHQVVVVDNASRDRSAQVARAAGARVVGIETFTFGRALNRGTAAAGGAVVVALSAHAYPRDTRWLARLAAHFVDPQVACAFGPERDARGRPLHEAVRQDEALYRAHPHWGYSNGAGAFRRELWEVRPFREDLPGSEDKEWALHWLARGKVCVMDPALAVDHDHEHDSLRDSFRRHAREARGYAMFLGPQPFDPLRAWWTDQGWHRSLWRARADPRRAARLAGRWWGSR